MSTAVCHKTSFFSLVILDFSWGRSIHLGSVIGREIQGLCGEASFIPESVPAWLPKSTSFLSVDLGKRNDAFVYESGLVSFPPSVQAVRLRSVISGLHRDAVARISLLASLQP